MHKVQVLPDWQIPANWQRIQEFLDHYGFEATETLVPGQTFYLLDDPANSPVMVEVLRTPTGQIMVTSLVFRGRDKEQLKYWAKLLVDDLKD